MKKDIRLTKHQRRVIKLCCEAFGCKYIQFFEKTRKREVINARGFAAMLLKEDWYGWKLAYAKAIGKDHATVLHTIRTFEGLLETDKKLLMKYKILYERLHPSPLAINLNISDAYAIAAWVLEQPEVLQTYRASLLEKFIERFTVKESEQNIA